jgi:hypothetical protein
VFSSSLCVLSLLFLLFPAQLLLFLIFHPLLFSHEMSLLHLLLSLLKVLPFPWPRRSSFSAQQCLPSSFGYFPFFSFYFQLLVICPQITWNVYMYLWLFLWLLPLLHPFSVFLHRPSPHRRSFLWVLLVSW